MTLNWGPSTSGGAPTTYVIEAGKFPGAIDQANFATGNTATTFSAAGVWPGTYYVRVRAANAAGTSPGSNEVIITVGVGGGACNGEPGPPVDLTFFVSGSDVTLGWGVPRGGSVPTSYVIQAGSSWGASNLADIDTQSTAISFWAPNVPPGSYFVRVLGKNGCGTGDASNEVIVTVP